MGRYAWEKIKGHHPVETLLGADIWERQLCVFLHGDKSNPILWGEFNGQIVPAETKWKIVSTEVCRRRQRVVGSYSPALEVKLLKLQKHVKWDKVFSNCLHHRLMLQDEDFPSEKGSKRFDVLSLQGMKDAQPIQRAGFDYDDPDFWNSVDDYVAETMKRTGHSAAPKPLVQRV